MKNSLIIVSIFFSCLVHGQEENITSKDNNAYRYALIEASRQKMIGNIKEAITLYNECINFNPECDVAYYELGTIFTVLDDKEKAESYFKKAYETDPENFWYGIAYSELLKINSNWEKAIEVLKNIRKKTPENTSTIDYKIAEIYSERGKYKKALNILNKIEKEKGLSEMISFMKIETLKRKKDFQLAEKELTKLVESVPDFAGYRIIQAEYYLEIKDTLKAIEAYEMACELDSADIIAVTSLSDLYMKRKNFDRSFYYLNRAFQDDRIDISNKIQALMMLTKDREMLKENNETIEKLVIQLLSRYSDNTDVKTVAYDFYNAIGNNLFAFALIKQIIKEKKDIYIIWQQALYNASILENYEEMITIGEEALKFFPNKSEIFLMVGMGYFQKEKYEDCYLKLIEGYTFLDGQNEIKLQYIVLLAESSYKTKRKTEAFKYYDELLKIDPGNNIVMNNYSYFLALEGIELEKAKKLSFQTVLKEPENSTYLDTYGWILFAMGNYNEAKIFIEKALRFNDEKDPDILFHYAEILVKLGFKTESKKYYLKAEEQGYNKDIIKQKLGSVNNNE